MGGRLDIWKPAVLWAARLATGHSYCWAALKPVTGVVCTATPPHQSSLHLMRKP